MKIRHILVPHEYQALDLEKKLMEGSSFPDLAAKYSTCPSAKSGGDLGDLTGRMDKLDEAFREACEDLDVGHISDPVRTRFGYHLILRYG